VRFVSKQPREGINVSATHPLADAGILIAGLGIAIFLITLALVFFVELAVKLISPKAEIALFESWQAEGLLVDRVEDDRQAQLQSLLDQVESENELALVLGHELGHFHHRDHLRGLGRGVLLGVLLTILTGGDVAGLGSSVADLTVRSFGREQESQADEFGLRLVYAEYGHTAEAYRLFERWEQDQAPSDAVSAYLSTHPMPGNRVRAMQDFVTDQGWRANGRVTALPWSVGRETLMPEPD